MPFFPHFELTSLVQLIGYPGIAAIIFTETGLFFGFFLPGASLLFTAGVAAAFGFLNIWALVPLVIVAAIAGDNVGYWFGSSVGTRLFSRPDSRFFKQKHVDQTRIYFEKYGTLTILLARFVPVVRTFAPILAGVGSMNYRLFFFYNVLGAFLWAGGLTIFGYVVGSKIPNAEDYVTPIVLAIIVFTFIPLFTHWWRQRAVSRVKACPRVAIFDVDDTLTESFKPPRPDILEKLRRLLERIPVAIMTATGFERIEREFLPALAASSHISRLYIFPNSSAECYILKDGAWERAYTNELSGDERVRIKQAVKESVAETGILKDVEPRGEQLIDRGAQIAFAAIGVEAPDEEKKSWDVDKTKRKELQRVLRQKLPGFEILIGGRTTIDITGKGINKSPGVRWFAKHLGIKPRAMLYVGDALYKGGNDAVVIPTGIKTTSTTSPEEPARIMDELLTVCSVKK